MYAECLCDHTTGCGASSFTTDGYGIFNVRNLGACRTHEGVTYGTHQTVVYSTLVVIFLKQNSYRRRRPWTKVDRYV